MKIQTIWIGLFILAGGCYCDFFSAPRSATEFGSKRLLNSFSTLDTQLKITEYNEDLSLNTTHNILRPENSDWTDVKSCDQYYLALATSNIDNSVTLLLLSPLNSLGSDLHQTKIQFNLTSPLPSYIAVAPSGRNFVYLNGTHLIVFEVEPQSLNWTIVAEENVMTCTLPASELAMSDSKISFISVMRAAQVIYNYKTKTLTLQDLPSTDDDSYNLGFIDTNNDYWLYTRSPIAILEYPNGDLQIFNSSSAWMAAFILPPQLSRTKEYIDIATIYVSSNFVIVTLGTLNSATHAFEQYNIIPSKSLGLLYKDNVADLSQGNLLQFGIGHSVLMYQLPNHDSSVALAVPSLPGNHSCSMDFKNRLGVFWCGGFGRSLTEQCPSGTYQPSTGYTTCLLCPEGTYQPKEGSIDCLKCKENEYCPMGSFNPEVLSNSSSHITWDFPISETATSFEEILLMLLFATSITSTSVSVVLLGCIIITVALMLSLLVKYCCGVNMHQWLAKIDIHKKTKTRTTTMAKPNGTFKTETIKVESVFGGYLTLLAVFILSVGLITTIIYVSDYHPLLVGQDSTRTPSQNSLRTSSLQDYNTQSKASELANVIKDNLHLNITIILHNFQTSDGEPMQSISVKNCYDQYGDDCTSTYSYALDKDGDAAMFNLQLKGSIQSSEAKVILVLGQAVTFTWATLEISSSQTNNEEKFQTSTTKYLILPGQDKVLTGLLMIPVTMTIVVRETELEEEFDHKGYMSFVADESKLRNLGHDTQTFAMTNDLITLQLLLQLDNNWRLESEQRRFSGVGAFFAALLAILGLYEVTLLASELAHRIFRAIEKRRKKRSKYQSLEDPPFIVNEKSE